MKAYDFEFDNKKLSDFGMILCRFDSGSGFETISDGCEITFNTIPVMNGKMHNLVSSQFDECLETTLQICKYSCSGGIKEITETEHRQLTRWLNRHKFLKLKILDEDHIDLYYEVRISVSKVEFSGKLIGLELDVLANTPFALHEPKLITIRNTEYDGKHSINDTSHEEGYIYPETQIVVNADGDLTIYNEIEDRYTTIKNCVQGETIIMDYPVIQSSVLSHNIQNDFNWNFFRVANTFENSRNDLTISLPCSIKIKYSPIVKVGL